MFGYVWMKLLEGRPRSYDRRMDRLSGGRVRAAKEQVAGRVPDGAEVLEIGCGAGELACLLAERGCRVEGFDLSGVMIEAAAERIEAEQLADRVTLQQMGVEGMDTLPEAAFDAVVSTLALSELSDDERRWALRHARRVLRPGGLLVLADEVVPRGGARRLLHAVARAPLAAMTAAFTGSGSRPLDDPAGQLTDAGFGVELEQRSDGDSFALVAARRASE